MVEEGAALSVQELADRTGVSVRTIRYYQAEGLLDAPVRSGREVRYGDGHRRRLEAITELQHRGLRLTAIHEILRHGDGAAAIAGWHGLGEALARPWSDDAPALVAEDDLAARLAGLPSGTREGLERTGVVERRADTTPVVYLVPSPGMLDVAVASLRLGLDLEVGMRMRDLLQARLRATAEELVARFTEEVSVAHLSTEGPDALAGLLDQLQPLTRRTVDLLFAHEMERAQRALLDDLAAAAEAGPASPTDSPEGTSR